MSRITSGSGASGANGAQSDTSNDSLRGLDMNEFLKLMITELQNQDPLNPMENNEILQQISQIREIEASNNLTTTLDGVLLSQNIASASNLLGKQVKALAGQGNQGEEVQGVVDSVTITDGKPTLHIGDKSFGLERVREIVNGNRNPVASVLPT